MPNSILASKDSSNPLPLYADLHNSTVKNKSTDAILPSYQGVNAMSDTNQDFHFSHLSAKDLEQNFSHCALESAKLTNRAAEATVQFVKQHPGEVVGTLCLVELCLKNPQIGKAAQEAVESVSARAAVGIDDALMMSRKSLQFPAYVVGKDEMVCLDQPAASSMSQVYMRARQSVARVETENSYASAFAVTRDGKFITNHHVVMNKGALVSDIKLMDRFGKSHVAEVVNVDHTNDLAVLQLKRPSSNPLFKPLKFGDGLVPGYKPKEQEEIFCFGHPHGSTELVGSIESNVRVRWNETPYWARKNTSVLPLHTESGNSGSPILNSRAEVVGILTGGTSTESTLYTSLSTAAPSNYANRLLKFAEPE
jgi:S1-C subfamily serine protease